MASSRGRPWRRNAMTVTTASLLLACICRTGKGGATLLEHRTRAASPSGSLKERGGGSRHRSPPPLPYAIGTRGAPSGRPLDSVTDRRPHAELTGGHGWPVQAVHVGPDDSGLGLIKDRALALASHSTRMAEWG